MNSTAVENPTPRHPTALEGGADGAADVAGMRGQNIVCFAKDWDEDPTSNNHVMKLLAANNRVLWLNSISTRTPTFTAGSDIAKIWRKLKSFSKGPRQVAENLWVYTPIVLPFPHSTLATRLNRHILRLTVRRLRRRFGMDRFQLWTFLPNAVEYVGMLGEDAVVYYCTDEWSKFGYVDGARMAAQEQSLLRRADVVFATAHSLLEARRPVNPEAHLASHGVDHATFAKALSDDVSEAPEVAALPKPILGFFGLIHEWVDQDLIAYLAGRHPEWSIVLIGKASVDISRIEKFPNVRLLGRKPYETLPSYCKAFSVGLIPFAINELTLAVNPIKLREYMSAGLPVVSTALPEVRYYANDCTVAETYEQFEQGVVDALRTDTPELRRRRSDAMRAESWERKVARLGDTVMGAIARKATGGPGERAGVGAG